MKTPDLPTDEETRLKNLRSLNILDTQSEERFDRLTRLARKLFDVPIAVVSLIDENRQWFKSCIGLNATETSRDISFCGHTILGDNVFIIPDATKDDRFSDNPLVTGEPNIRFYAGCPLKFIDGSKLGTLCIIDSKPKTLSDDNIATLTDLAGLAERELIAIQLATLDDLTNISNRRGFINLAQKSLELCIRQNIPASLAYLDLNKFKSINDNFGHAEGDKALIVFADKMIETFRDSDVFARLAGDEFVVFLTNTSYEVAENTISRFRESIDQHNRESNQGYEILFSEGIIEIDLNSDATIETILSKADAMMYKKKQLLAKEE